MTHRGVAQSGRVLALGARCRRFEPFRPDHEIQTAHQERFFFCFLILSLSSKVVFLGNVIFILVSNFLMSNFNGFCMALEYVRNEDFNDFL